VIKLSVKVRFKRYKGRQNAGKSERLEKRRKGE